MLEELLALGHAGAEYDAWLIRINEGDAVRQRLRRRQSQLEDPGAARPQRPDAGARVRVRRDPAVPGREVRRRLPADRRRGARRVPVVAVLADGQRAVPRRRLRPLLRLCAEQDRIRDRPLRDGGEAPARRARPAPGREPATSPATTTRSPTWRSGRGTARWSRASCTARASSSRCRTYTNVLRWTDEIAQRPAVQRGRMVNRTWGEPASQLHERHDASDFDETRTSRRRDGAGARAVPWSLCEGIDDDHPLRLRHGAEPAPRAHPARREGRPPRDGAGRPAQPASSSARRSAASTRSAPCRRCAPTTACC